MDVSKMLRPEDLPFDVPAPLARTIGELREAYARDDVNIDVYLDEVEGSARYLCPADDRRVLNYYVLGGWMRDGGIFE